MYLFLFKAVLGLHCCTGFFSCCYEDGYSSYGALASHRSGFSGCSHRLSARGLPQVQHMDSEAMAHQFQRTGSVVVAHQHSGSVAHGVLHSQGSNPCLLHWQADYVPLSHQACVLTSSLSWFWCTPRFEIHCFRLSKSL